MLRKSSGITLIALVVTIVILLILAGTATFTGMSAIENSRITTFRTEMEMMKLQLNSPSELEKYKNAGSALEESQKNYLTKVQNSLNQDNISITLEIDGFKYFTKEEIKTISNIETTRDLYINPDTKTIVSSEGIDYDGKTYYMIEQLPNSLYNVENNIQNSGDVTFDLTADKLSITVSNIQYNAPYVNKGTIQYKLSTDENWTTVAQDTTSKNFTFEVPASGEYNIRIIDAKNNEGIGNIIIDKTVLEYATQAMPAGAYIDTTTNEDTGIVMIDSNENEWVWVEVPASVFTTATSSTDYDNIKTDLIAYAEDYREGSKGQGRYWTDQWYAYDESTSEYIFESTEGLTDEQKELSNGCGLTYAGYKATYNKMLNSVYTNKGFYIGRYEAGIEGSDEEISLARKSYTAITTSSPKAVSKKDMIPYNYVYCSDAQQLANGMATGNKTSSLLFGIQWDLTCKFLEVNSNLEVADIKTDSTSWGNHSSSTFIIDSTNAKKYSTWESISGEKTGSVLLTTGASEYTNKMNIYDFAGNEWEWTLESTDLYGYPCSDRGGSCGYDGSYCPASHRA